MPELTQLGIGLVPLCLLCFGNARRLLLIAVFVTVFGAASALNLHLGSFQVSVIPPYFPALVFTTFCVLRYCAGQSWGGEAQVARICVPFFLFGIYSVAATLAMTHALAGRLLVWPQRPDVFNVRVLLDFGTGNISQLGYLIFTVVFLFLAACYVERNPWLAERILHVSFIAGYAAVLFGFWQLAHKLAGVAFPETLLFSNINGDMNDQTIAGSVFRVSGSFTEPAHLAGHVGGTVYATFWLILAGDARPFVLGLFVLSTVLMLLSTSTAGYILLAVGLPAMMILAATRGSSQALLRLLKIALCLGVAVAAAIVTVPKFDPDLAANAQMILDDTVNKRDSTSYEERSTWDADALALVVPTFGFGAGWGSTRTSSLLPSIVGNCGLWGFALFAWFVARVFVVIRRTRRRLARHPQRLRVVDALSASVVAYLFGAILAGPNLNSMEAWLALAALIGVAARMARSAAAMPAALAWQAAAARRPPPPPAASWPPEQKETLA